MTDRLCVVCPQLRKGDPRPVDRPIVCEGCRARLRSLLVDLVEVYAELGMGHEVNAGRWVDEYGNAHLDQVAASIPAGPVPTKTGVPISGSREAPLPLLLDPVDLTLPAHVQSVHDDLGDQIGQPSVPARLDTWARDWQTYRPTYERLPAPTVALLAGWLTERLDWACDSHPAVDDFAAELADLVRRVRDAAQLRPPRPELKVGIPCRECDSLALYRWPGSDYVECGACDVLLTPEEYQRWTELISQPEWRGWVRHAQTASLPQ